MQKNPQKQLPWLMETQSLNQQPKSPHGTDLGLLHICDNYVVYSVCGNSGSGAEAIPGAMAALGNLLPMQHCLA